MSPFCVLFFPLQAHEIINDMEDGSSKSEDFGADEDIEIKATKVEVGDNFVVTVGEMENGDPFFVILCNKPLHQCEVTFTNGWGNMWYEGDMF